jgi:peptidylprolyl isomerase
MMDMVRHVLAVALVAATLSGCTLKPPPEDTGMIPAPSDVAAPPADALRTPSGLASKVLRVGLGSVHPGSHSTVRVHYTGWTPDGKMFESSVARNSPATFQVDGVIPGWTEGLQLMVAGEKRRFWIPGDLAYDKLDMPGAPKGPLVFDIELLDVR